MPKELLSIEQLVAPIYEPVSLADMRDWLRLDSDNTSYDTAIRMLTRAMREQAETITGRCFIPRQLRANYARWGCSEYGATIELPVAPLVRVDSVKYIDTDGVLQTLNASLYSTYYDREPACIVAAYGEVWPSLRFVPNAVQVTFIAGYAPGSPDNEADYQESMPDSLKLWMQSKVATHNEFREQVISGTIIAKLPRDFTDGLLDPLILGSRLFG